MFVFFEKIAESFAPKEKSLTLEFKPRLTDG